MIVGILLLWLAFAVAAAWAAKQKGRSAIGYFLLSILVTPVLAFLVLLVVPVKVPKVAASSSTRCPSCARAYDGRHWSTCPYCGTRRDDGQQKKCPACAEWIKAETMKCRHCGEALTPV